MILTSLKDIQKKATQTIPIKISVAVAEDKNVLEAIKAATRNNIISPILVGDKEKINNILSEIDFDINDEFIIDVKSTNKAVEKAVELVAERKAAILMKGLVSTGTLLKAVLKDEYNLKKTGLLSHLAIFESPYYHKLFGLTDAAMNIAPTLDEKVHLLNNAVDIFRKLGINKPKIAALSAVETVNQKMEATIHASLLATMNKRDQIKNCIVDGPLALDNAISKEAASHKNIMGNVAGDADILLAPDINSGNILYKSLNFLGGSSSAAIITGAKVPIVLTSRSDNEKSKLMSIALAKLISE